MSVQAPIVEIFSQGDEVVSGEVVDTNAAWLAQELSVLGFDVSRHSAVGDRIGALTELLVEISARADCCLCSGGLGPTCDDLTAEAVARAFGAPLALDESALREIEARFTDYGLPMPPINRKQALLPQGARRLPNAWGTAPGFAFDHDRCRFFFLPGVPTEMQRMFQHRVVPELRESFKLQPRRLIVLRTLGIGESALQERLNVLSLPSELHLGFRATAGEVQVKLLFPFAFDERSLQDWVDRLTSALGPAVFAIEGLHGQGGGDLADVVGRLLLSRNATLALAEAVSGGLLASQCAGREWFAESLVCAEHSRLCHHLGVALPSSHERTALPEIAVDLAEALRLKTGADFAITQIGSVSADGVEAHFALAAPTATRHQSSKLRGDRQRIQAAAATLTLDMIRRSLLD